MAGISALGIGSGVLSSDLVEKLVSAEREGTELRLNQKAKRNETLISSFGKIQNAITELRLPARKLTDPAAMTEFKGTSSSGNVGVSVDSAKASRGTYSVEVQSLAKAQSLATAKIPDRDATSVGSGEMTIQVGDQTKTITVDGSNDTLTGLANAINKAGVGATASVIDTGEGYQLVLSADETGTANAIQISVADSDGNDADAVGLSQLAFNASVQNLTETVAAEDAALTVNGIAITRSTNTVEGVIEGVTFDLSTTGPATVKVEQDYEKVADRVGEFVAAYNNLQSIIKDLTAYDAEEQQGGPFTGDSTVRNITNQLRQVLGSVVPGLEGANVRSLADVGLKTDYQTGGLEFDRSQLISKLKSDPDDVTALFSQQGRTSDSQVEFVRSGVNTEHGDYDINVTKMATRGSYSGTAVADSILVDPDNDNFSIKVDDANAVELTLEQGTYTRDELVVQIQAQLDANAGLRSTGKQVQVTVDPATNGLVFTSGKYGSESQVAISGLDTNCTATLGLESRAGTAGEDVEGTIDGRSASGDGQVLYLKGSDGGAEGLQVKVTGGDVGPRGQVSFIQGIGQSLVDRVSSFLGEGGLVSSKSNSFRTESESIQQEREKLEKRITSYQERLMAQFSAADALVSQLNSTGDYLTQQLAALNPSNKN